jgi:hypothetical protein
VSDTPAPSATAVVPAVLDRNVFRPGGSPLRIDFRPLSADKVTVRIYNLAGELVRPLLEADVAAGLWLQVSWDGHNVEGQTVAAGVYLISVKGAGIKTIKKVVVLR